MAVSAMSTAVRAGEKDLRALAAIVSQDRPDLPPGEGLLPPSLVADLMHYNGRRPQRSRELRPARPDHPVADLSGTG